MRKDYTHRSLALPLIKEMYAELDVKGKSILEIGYGTDKEFRNLFEELGMVYTGTDMINFFSGDEYHVNRMEDLKDFEEDTFDFVFSCHTFEHCERPIDALREIHRVLKSGGRMILITPWCCKHHIIDADEDHIFVLNSYQMLKLIYYTGFNGGVKEQKDLDVKEQDFNIITWGDKLGL